MVKKIRILDQVSTDPEESVTTAGADNDMMELAKSMDWKLWEMLQILQRLEKQFSEEK